MPKLQQSDISSGAISFSRNSNFAVTTTVTYAQSNLTKTAYSLGTVAGMAASDPFALKELGSGNTNWSDEQDWTAYNQSFTTSIPVVHTTSGTSSYTLSTNASISVGDLVGIYGAGSWSAGALLSISKDYPSGAGSQNATFIAGGRTSSGPTQPTDATELFNGSSWSTSGVLSVAKYAFAAAGSQGAGLIAGGHDGTSRSAASELHNQTLYRKIVNYQDLRSACSVGVAFDISSLTLSVKFNGYIDNVNVTSSNISITDTPQWVGKFVTLPRFSPNTATTNNPSSVVVKSTVTSEDLLVGYAVSRTQMQVFTGILFSRDRIGGW